MLRRRGVTSYVGHDRDLLTRAWPEYREAIDTNWFAYLDGRMTFDEAIGKIVEAAKR